MIAELERGDTHGAFAEGSANADDAQEFFGIIDDFSEEEEDDKEALQEIQE